MINSFWLKTDKTGMRLESRDLQQLEPFGRKDVDASLVARLFLDLLQEDEDLRQRSNAERVLTIGVRYNVVGDPVQGYSVALAVEGEEAAIRITVGVAGADVLLRRELARLNENPEAFPQRPLSLIELFQEHPEPTIRHKPSDLPVAVEPAMFIRVLLCHLDNERKKLRP